MPQMGVSVAEGTIVAWRVAGGRPDRRPTRRSARSPPTRSTPRCRRRSPAWWPRSSSTVEATVEVGDRAGPDRHRGRRGRGLRRSAEPSPVAAPRRPSRRRVAAATPRRAPRRRGGNGAAGTRRYSPVVQRIAAEHGIDLDHGDGHRSRRARAQAGRARAGQRQRARCGAEDPPLHIESPYRPDPVRRLRLLRGSGARPRLRAFGGRRSASAGHCRTAGRALADAPPDRRPHEALARHRGHVHDLDRGRHERAWRRPGARLKVTALSFVARACIDALREYPALNAWLEGEKLHTARARSTSESPCRSARTG